MEIKQFIHFMSLIEKLKCNTRHSWTSTGREESVAEHSWRLALMAYFVKDEFPQLDIDKVILMCLVHDFGEAITGDIPAFLKTQKDELVENDAIDVLLNHLPHEQKSELEVIFEEMTELKTPEAKLYKALDKMEAVMQHNEADISTWLPLEYELQMTYGSREVAHSDYLMQLKNELNDASRAKIEEESAIQ